MEACSQSRNRHCDTVAYKICCPGLQPTQKSASVVVCGLPASYTCNLFTLLRSYSRVYASIASALLMAIPQNAKYVTSSCSNTCTRSRLVAVAILNTRPCSNLRQSLTSTDSDPWFESWFADFCQNVVDSLPCRRQSFRRVSWKSAGDCMRNANKSPKIPNSALAREVESDPESASGTRPPAKVNQFFQLVQVSMKSADYFCSNAAHRHTDRQTDRLTDKRHRQHNLCLGEGN